MMFCKIILHKNKIYCYLCNTYDGWKCILFHIHTSCSSTSLNVRCLYIVPHTYMLHRRQRCLERNVNCLVLLKYTQAAFSWTLFSDVIVQNDGIHGTPEHVHVLKAIMIHVISTTIQTYVLSSLQAIL